jgi:hypothetical protein
MDHGCTAPRRNMLSPSTVVRPASGPVDAAGEATITPARRWRAHSRARQRVPSRRGYASIAPLLRLLFCSGGDGSDKLAGVRFIDKRRGHDADMRAVAVSFV